ncbi:hypothetical protein B0H19DRAFT_1058075 [Mycena capillaripes]|nr:hypothetical protein B0H19DRAFT_1058075 [Mycena capillaripes]
MCNQKQELPDLSIGTVTTFLVDRPDNGTSVLLKQTSCLASQYRPEMSNKQLNQIYVSFSSIETLDRGVQTKSSHGKMLVIHSLVNVATIQLPNPFCAEVEESHLRKLAAVHTAQWFPSQSAERPT